MSQYSRDSYRRRRQEEQMMFQRMAAEQANIQQFLLLQQDNITTESIGGNISDPIPSVITNVSYAYTGPSGSVNFSQSTVEYAKSSYQLAVANSYSIAGQNISSYVTPAVGVTMYQSNYTPYSQGNYVINTNQVMTINSSGVITAIINFADIGGSGTIVFNGTNQYVSAPNAQVTTWLPGTGDFTIEWFMKKGSGGSSFPRVFSLGYDTTATIGCSIESGTCYIWPYGGALSGSMPAGYDTGSWVHVAICRSGTTTKLFIGGVLKSTKTGDSRNITNSINPGFNLNMGVDNPSAGSPNWWSGNLTNFRWDNSAIYTGSSLTVPVAPLSVTPTTKLLMLGGTTDNPVADATGINTLTNNGATWSASTPF